jgi:hypothetical protein
MDISATSMASDSDSRLVDMDLDANFEVLSRNLHQKMVAIAAQSVSEETRVTTHYRWKTLKGNLLFAG